MPNASSNSPADSTAGAAADSAAGTGQGAAQPSRLRRFVALLPGLGVAALATAIAWPISMIAPILSPLLVAIILGIVVGNFIPTLPAATQPGLAYAAKPLLRLGIVCLGAQVVLGDILDLGWLVLVLAAVIVAVGIFGSLAFARLFRVESDLALLIGCGFGICGAAAVAGVESTLRSKKEDVAAAIGLVVLFGTLMIAIVPSLAGAFGLSQETAGMWGGSSTHEVAQVVAIGGIIGPVALQIAVLVKLSRVIMLAPTVALLSLAMRRKDAANPDAEVTVGKRPPIIPLWVLGFLAMAALRTFGLLPEFAITGLGWIQTVFLAMAMFALGRGVQWRALKVLGGGALGVATCTTVLIGLVGLGGALLLT